jgi:hypothetical protein
LPFNKMPKIIEIVVKYAAYKSVPPPKPPINLSVLSFSASLSADQTKGTLTLSS